MPTTPEALCIVADWMVERFQKCNAFPFGEIAIIATMAIASKKLHERLREELAHWQAHRIIATEDLEGYLTVQEHQPFLDQWLMQALDDGAYASSASLESAVVRGAAAETLRALVTRGAAVTHRAIVGGIERREPDVLAVLVGATASLADLESERGGSSFLHDAARVSCGPRIVRMLLRGGSDPGRPDHDGLFPVDHFAYCGAAVIEAFLDEIDPETLDTLHAIQVVRFRVEEDGETDLRAALQKMEK